MTHPPITGSSDKGVRKKTIGRSRYRTSGSDDFRYCGSPTAHRVHSYLVIQGAGAREDRGTADVDDFRLSQGNRDSAGRLPQRNDYRLLITDDSLHNWLKGNRCGQWWAVLNMKAHCNNRAQIPAAMQRRGLEHSGPLGS